jgi:uncharacterized membrane protein
MALTRERSERTGLTRGQIVLAGSALLLVVAFFLPWVNAGPASPSGMGIAGQPGALQPLGLDGVGVAPLLYLVPALGLLALALAFVRGPASGPAGAGAGLLGFVLLVVFLLQLNQAPVIVDAVTNGGTPLPFLGVGIWLSLVCVIAISVGGMMLATRYMSPGTALNTRRIVTSGMLGAVAVTLGVTRLGFIPVPNVSGNATIMHLPAIVGAVLEGPVVGIVTGGIFGLFSWLNATSPLFANPIVAVLPRVLIGLLAWVVYRSLARFNVDVAAAVAGVVGTLTNTIGVLGLGVATGLLPAAVIPTIIPQAVAELVLAAVLTPIIARAVTLTRSGRTVAEDTVPREKSYY